MEKGSHSQLEFFSQSPSGYVNTKRQASYHVPLLGYMRGHERVILMVISFIIIGIISFSLGVERGKGMALLKSNSRLDLALKNKPASSYSANNKPYQQNQIEKRDVLKQPELQASINNYTIQVASYQSQKFAQREAESLKRRNFTPLILSKGKYVVLCVGNFSSIKTAEPLLEQLKKSYHDCLIRKL